jgi:hypothetical protein
MVRSAGQPPTTTADAPPAPPAAQFGSSGAATWMDIAPLLDHACAAMQPGELVQADSFSLFESVSAVEIGAHDKRCPSASHKHSDSWQDGAYLHRWALQVKHLCLTCSG